MAKRNTSRRSGSRPGSSSGSGSSKRPFSRRSDGPSSPRPHKSSPSGRPPRKEGDGAFDTRRNPRPASPGSGRKFDSKKSDKNFGDKPPYKKAKGFTSSRGEERPRRKFDSGAPKGERPYKKFDRKDSSDRGEFKKEGSRFKPKSSSSPGLRRESSYKRPTEDQGGDVKKEGRLKRKDFKSEPRKKFIGKKVSNFKGDSTQGLEAPVQTGKIRLNKFIANSGVCSRREADELIKMGLISVNGKTITELGYKVNPGDEVRHESKVLHAEKPVYILMNKPKGFLTTTSDPQERNTVMHLIGNHVKERVYPVGRLDRNTTGLLLLTNDGDLADKLMHPSYNVKKIYKVELDRPITKADAQVILDGVQLEEGKAMVDDIAIISDDKRTVGIEIHIGWNRVVRRIFEALNYEVVKLDRSVYAGLDKKDLGRGEWRFLTKEELVRLKHYK